MTTIQRASYVQSRIAGVREFLSALLLRAMKRQLLHSLGTLMIFLICGGRMNVEILAIVHPLSFPPARKSQGSKACGYLVGVERGRISVEYSRKEFCMILNAAESVHG
jgi:hypothetical protein